MAKTQDEIISGNLGMNLDNHPSNLREGEYRFARNANLESDSGDFGNLQNEPSNLLELSLERKFCGVDYCYQVIGFKVDTNNDKVYLFLTDPRYKKSEIGCINAFSSYDTIEDIEVACGCNVTSILDEALEGKKQEPFGNYETIIHDHLNSCLNFDVNCPIHNIEFKDKKCSDTLYWVNSDGYPMYLDLTNIEQYKYCSTDGECIPVDTSEKKDCDTTLDCQECDYCLDCDKLKIFKKYDKACIEAVSIDNGGNLKMGVYEFLLAYSDREGNELSRYHSITPPIAIFDENQITQDQTESANRTGKLIKLNVSNLDTRFDYYKIAVIQTADIDGSQSYYEEGVHAIDQTTIIYESEINKPATNLSNLFSTNVFFEKAEGLTTSSGRLFIHGLTAQKEINLQPLGQLLGAFLRWQTNVAKENLYKNGVASSTTKGYRRNEVYPFALGLCMDNGYETLINLSGRPPQPNDVELVDFDSQDVMSVNECAKSCGDTRDKKWQYYNTSSLIGQCPSANDLEHEEVESQEEVTCLGDVQQIPSGSVTFLYNENYESLLQYINFSDVDICSLIVSSSSSQFCDILSEESPTPTCTPDIKTNCENLTLTSSRNIISNVVNEVVTNNPSTDILDYDTLAEPSAQIYQTYETDVNNNNSLIEDTSLTNLITPIGQPQKTVYEKKDYGNTSCLNAETISNIGFAQTPIGKTITEVGDADINNIKTDLQSFDNTALGYTPISAECIGFTDKIHEGAIWYKFNTTTEGIALQTSELSDCNLPFPNNNRYEENVVRVTVYEECPSSTTVPILSKVVNLDSQNLTFLSNLNTSNTHYVVIDAPIRTHDISNTIIPELVYTTASPCGTFALATQGVKYLTTTVSYDAIEYQVEGTYGLTCTYFIPKLDDCQAYPYQYGKMGYWESTEEYPDNCELYNGEKLIVSPQHIPISLRDEFESYFVDNIENDKYVWKTQSDKSILDLRCSPIRHPKMPCNKVAPQMTTCEQGDNFGFIESLIFPLGVTIDVELIKGLLDAAVESNLIDQDTRDRITQFKLYRGDRKTQQSVVASGILVDMMYDSVNKNYYPNYPQNDLKEDDYHEQAYHPFGGIKNNRYYFHSPTTQFNRSTNLGSEIKLNGFLTGKSRGAFAPVKRHPRFTILGKEARVLATILSTVEVTADFILNEAYKRASIVKESTVGPGTTNVGVPIASIILATAQLVHLLTGLPIQIGRKRYEWLEVFKNNGELHQFAYYHSQEGFYNTFCPNILPDNEYRGICSKEYLKDGLTNIKSDLTASLKNVQVNTIDREWAVYLSLGNNHFIEYPNYILGLDNSRYIDTRRSVGRSREYIRDVAVPYVTMYDWIPDQYGKINSVNWLETGFCGDFKNTNVCQTIFGGDTFITRHTHVSKTPHFIDWLVGTDSADNIPFNYSFYNNIGKARYFLDYGVAAEDNYSTFIRGVGSTIFPDIQGDYRNLDYNRAGFYIKPPAKFYLYSYGVFNYLVESEINTCFRHEGEEPHEWYYGGTANDYMTWADQDNFNIREQNEYRYNNVYSRDVTPTGATILPSNYSKKLFDCRYDLPNGYIYSNLDISQNNILDPYLSFKPASFSDFSNNFGDLVDIRDVGSGVRLARFTNGFQIQNSLEILRERLTQQTDNVGTNPLGESRPIDGVKTEIGYGGTQHKAIASSPFGHFWVDAKRGQVFQISSNGSSFSEISSQSTQGSTNTRKWFKKHLPFKIKQGVIGLTEEAMDNSFNGLGISMGWDDVHRRLFLTKLDYKVKEGRSITYRGKEDETFATGFYDTLTNERVFLEDKRVFENCSWTIAYSPVFNRWISFYDFIPNYYISLPNHFKTGVKNGIWAHLLTNKSYQVFYGKKYPFEVEFPSVNKFNNKYFQSLSYKLIARRYTNDVDYHVNNQIGFDTVMIYNDTQSSGLGKIIKETKNDMFQACRQPKFNKDSFNIVATSTDGFWSLNNFWNNVKDECNGIPIFNHDCNEIEKIPNQKAMNFEPTWKDRLRGDWFLIRLSYIKDTRYKIIFKWANIKATYYA